MNIGSPTEDNKVTDPKVHQLLQFFSGIAPEAQRVFKILISRGMPVRKLLLLLWKEQFKKN